MFLALVFAALVVAALVWLMATLAAIRRNTGRTVELLERAERSTGSSP